jgi:tetratricopeptide (TPR) repeat protein
MGKASRRKRASINEAPGIQDKHDNELTPSQKSSPKVHPHRTTSTNFAPIMILLLVSFSVYFNALFGDFIYDDQDQIVKNPWIKDVRNIPTIFSRSVWSFQPGLSTWNYYRPLMHIVYLFNYHIFGLNPLGFHLVNILFHCGTSVLVFLIIRKFLTAQNVSKASVYFSAPFVAAMLFASHPIHTEAVTWIAGLPDVAFTFFYLLSFYLYILFRDGVKRGYLSSLLSFSVALLFKEPALTLPIMLIAYDYKMKNFDETLLLRIRRYIPFIVVSGIYLSVRYYALGSFVPLESYADLSTYQFIINIFPLFREYLTSLLWPFNLNFWHTFHPISTLSEAGGMISVLVAVIFIVVTVLAAYKKNKTYFFGLLLIIIPLLPAFYIKGISGKPYAERYLYLPSVGYVFLLSLFFSWAKDKLPRAAKSITIVFIVIVGIYVFETINRNNVWENNFSFWSDTVKKSPDCAVAHNELARVYTSQGQLDKAIAEVQAALRLKPDSANAHISLGNLYAAQGQWDRAKAEFEAALRLKPNDHQARKRLNDILSRPH